MESLDTTLAELVQELRELAPDVWALAVREVWVDIVTIWVVVAVLFTIGSIVLFSTFKWCIPACKVKVACNHVHFCSCGDKFDIKLLTGTLGVIATALYCVGIGLAIHNIGTMLNVDYHAIGNLPMI